VSSIVPSFIAKLNRVEEYLHDLRAEIERYGGADSTNVPFTVKVLTHGMRKIHRLHFTRAVVNTDVPVIAADAIYNLRSSLEHLMAALVANKDRDRVMFPILWRGVWDAPIPGENDQRTKDRERWGTISRAVRPAAPEFLKRLQPPDDDPNKQSPHALRLLNQISVTLLQPRTRTACLKTGLKFGRSPRGRVRQALWACRYLHPDRAREPARQEGNLHVVEFVENTRDSILDKVIPPFRRLHRCDRACAGTTHAWGASPSTQS
jgi:hypothetical protein